MHRGRILFTHDNKWLETDPEKLSDGELNNKPIMVRLAMLVCGMTEVTWDPHNKIWLLGAGQSWCVRPLPKTFVDARQVYYLHRRYTSCTPAERRAIMEMLKHFVGGVEVIPEQQIWSAA